MVFTVFTFAVAAQSDSGSIKGVVLDRHGAVIPGARVTLNPKNNGNEKPRSVLSNADGEFVFSNLPSGLYELELKVSWTETTIKKPVEIKSGELSESTVKVTLMLEGCSGDEQPNISLTDEDRAEIVRQMLVLLGEKHSNLLMSEQLKSKLILSTENIEPGWLTAENRQKFNLLKQSEIQSLADTKSDFPYLKFSNFKVKGNCVEISLDNIWAVGKNSQTAYLSGGGHTYEFRKVEGRWFGKLSDSWVS